MNKLLIIFALSSTLAFAQNAPTEYPEGSVPLSAQALQSAVDGKVLVAQPAKGAAWRLQYDKGGIFKVDIGKFSDSGNWSVKDSTVCSEAKQVKYFCNEFRVKDDTLYMKRESGEVLKFAIQ